MKRWKWLAAWAVQFVESLAAGLLVGLTDLLGAGIYGFFAWAGMSIVGMFSAYRATRRGLLNYAAWIAPPLCMWLGHWLLWRYSPSPGPVLLCALFSLVGAAAGEVKNQQDVEK